MVNAEANKRGTEIISKYCFPGDSVCDCGQKMF